MQKSIGKWEIRPLVKSYPLKYHFETLRTGLPNTQILVSIGTLVASRQIGAILRRCDFFDCPYLFLDPVPRSNRWTDVHALWLTRLRFRTSMFLRVRIMGEHIFGGNMPSTP